MQESYSETLKHSDLGPSGAPCGWPGTGKAHYQTPSQEATGPPASSKRLGVEGFAGFDLQQNSGRLGPPTPAALSLDI